MQLDRVLCTTGARIWQKALLSLLSDTRLARWCTMMVIVTVIAFPRDSMLTEFWPTSSCLHTLKFVIWMLTAQSDEGCMI